MKKLILLFLLLFLKFAPAKAQWVTIPDANFVTKLQQLFPNCMSGNQMDTTCAGIVNATSLQVTYSNISNLFGVQYFDNLLTLKCYNNQLTSLPALPNSLLYLDCMSNNLTSLPTLPNSLLNLHCPGNDLVSLPTLPNNLISLNCNSNSLDYLPALPNSIKRLHCSGNQQLSSFISLPDSLNLFSCSYCGWFGLPFLPNTLDTLFCGSNNFTTLPALPDSLKYLDCSFGEFTTISGLPNSLKYLDCSSGNLNTLNLFQSSLEILYCQSNGIMNFPFLPSTLKLLNCSNNYLTYIPTLPSILEFLSCSQNNINNLPSLPNLLYQLDCSNNNINSIPILPNSLISLSCGYNQLTILPTLPNSLSSLNCNNNLLTTLPNLPVNLSYLVCNNNQLTSIPPLPDMMQSLDIRNNNIICINNLPDVDYAFIQNNPFTCVPNQTNYSLGLPLCIDNDTINNPNNCISTVNVSGYVFTNLYNSNCIYNSYDLESANIPVKLYDSLNYLVAQSYTSGGAYGFMVNQAGTYKVKIDTENLPIEISCALADSQIVNLVSITTGVSNINYPVVCDSSNYYDVNVQSISSQGWIFPGQLHTINTNVINNENWYNLNCTNDVFSGTVTINISGQASYISPVLGALTPTVSGNTFTYNISNFNNLNANSFGLQLMTDTTAQAGNQICVHVEISTSPIDANTTNNAYDFCYNVVNSYDPNMKEVYPVDVLPGYDDWFTYTIHFQNTGNAPAFNIRLRDTLDTQLDLNTFEVLGYSHPANVGLSGNILTVRFNNIMLPDSTSDYEGSMGYFQYRIKPIGVLLSGSQINNTAYIYFDYNAPIITNTTENNFICSPVNYPQSYSFCAGDSVLVGNNWYSSAGNFSNSYVTPVGCDSIVITIITETSIDTSVVLTGNTLNAVSGYVNYSWIDCSTGLEIDGENSNELVAPYAGFFKSVITSTDGCVSESSCIAVILTGNETTLNSNTQTFEIYPNPSSGIFTFKDTKNIQRVEVYDVLGQEIAVFVGDNTNKVSKQINLSGYSKGVYFAKINGSIVLKMVKE
jgi:uncharacterized repeat protein (TIGR01451 family)